jgi:hypothetical protein
LTLLLLRLDFVAFGYHREELWPRVPDAAFQDGPIPYRVSVAIRSGDGIFKEGLIFHHGSARQGALDLINYVGDGVSVANYATFEDVPADE